jgi:hypothetical protein
MGRTVTGQARTAKVMARTTEGAKQKLLAEAERRGMTESDAVREALNDWMNKKGTK